MASTQVSIHVDVVSQIEDVEKSISKREDREVECQLMEDHNKMLKEMSPSCLAISVLGRLMLVTHDHDVSLDKKTPLGGFKHIKYPQSLRASLVQVANGGHDAFQAAHINMDQIRLLTIKIPDLLNEVIVATAQGTSQDMQIITRDALDTLGNRAKRCTDLAADTKGQFIQVMDLIQELLEAATASRGIHEQELKKNTQRLAILKAQKIHEEEMMKETRKKKEDMKAALDTAREMHKDAMDSIPGNWELLGLKLVNEVVDCIGNSLKVTNIFSSICPVGNKSSSSRGPEHQQMKPAISPALISANAVLTMTTKGLLSCFSSTKQDILSFKQPNDGLLKVEDNCRKIATRLSKLETKTSITQQVTDVANSLAQMCKQLTDMTSQNNKTGVSEAWKPLKQKAEQHLQELQSIDMAIDMLANQNPTPNRSPAPAPARSNSGESMVNTIVENAHYKVEKAQESLKMYEENTMKAEKEAREHRERLQKTMSELKELDLTKTDMENIQKVLMKGFQALTEVVEVWGALVRFFANIANMVEVSFYGDILAFDKKAENVLNYKSQLNRSLMYDYARSATQSTMAVQSLSSMYVYVSEKHFLPPLAEVSKMIYPREGVSVLALADELDRECNASVRHIAKVAFERKEKYQKQVRDRIAKLEKAKKSLPPISRKKQVEIVTVIKRGMEIDPNDF